LKNTSMFQRSLQHAATVSKATKIFFAVNYNKTTKQHTKPSLTQRSKHDILFKMHFFTIAVRLLPNFSSVT
jgi:hypothetical protein